MIFGLALAAVASEAVAKTQTGTAVYYSDKMDGKTLALKGEKYDKNAMTAATHAGFPMGSNVKVTNLANNKSVTVKVNDRMNPKSKSVIDLSRKAAEELDIIHAGHARVRVESEK
jgi:rare lipoprotein A